MTHISSVVCVIAINRHCLTGSLWLKSLLHNPLCGHPQSDLCYILACSPPATCALLLYCKVHVRGGQQVQIYFTAPDKSYYLCVPPRSIKVWWIGSFYWLRVDTEVRLIFNHIKMCMHCVIHKHNECRLLRSSHAGCPTINSAQMPSVWLWNKFCDRHTVLTAQWESCVTSSHTDYRLPLTDCTDTLMSHVSAQQPH